MDNAKIEAVYNRTFPGLAMFYRDADLSPTLVSNYKAGEFLRERGFTDLTHKSGGLAANTRFLVASNNARDVGAIMPHMQAFGMVMLQSDAFFKILDVHSIGAKTQILLLHINSEDVDFFKSAQSNIEEQIIEKARQHFKENAEAEPIAELQSEEWRNRTQFPIGQSDEGELFALEGLPTKSDAPQHNAKPWWKFW